MDNTGTHVFDGRSTLRASHAEGKKRQRREQYLDRLMQEKVSQRTGMLVQRSGIDELGKSGGQAPVKAHRQVVSPTKRSPEQVALQPQRTVAHVRNLEPFGAPGNMVGPGSTRAHLPQIHKGRQVARYQQLESNDDFLAGESNDNNGTRNAIKPIRGSTLKLSGHNVSPPSLAVLAVGAIGSGLRDMPSPRTGAAFRGSRQRSPEAVHGYQARGESLPLSINQKAHEPQYPKSYKQVLPKKGQLGERGIGLVDGGAPGTSKSVSREYASSQVERQDRDGAAADLFDIRINSKVAQDCSTERKSGGRSSLAPIEKVRGAKYSSIAGGSPHDPSGDHGAAITHAQAFGSKKAIRHVREKTRLLEEVRENKERAIERAQAQVGAQQRRRIRAEAGALNFSMRFEGEKDMAKFERHVEEVFSKKKKAKKVNRNALSIDFGGPSFGLNLDLQQKRERRQWQDRDKEDSEARAKAARGSQLNVVHKSSLLPRIEGGEQHRSVHGASMVDSSRRKRLGISSIDGSTMISRREKKYKYSNAKEKLKAFDFLAQSKENAGTFLLRSHHYKYNRIKEGGWGAIELSSDSSRGDANHARRSTQAAAERLAAGSEGSQGHDIAAKEMPLLLNSASNMGDLWTHDPLPRLNAAHVAEVNRLIKLENQRGSIGRSTQGDQSSQHEPALRSSIHAGKGAIFGDSAKNRELQGLDDKGSEPSGRRHSRPPPDQPAMHDLSRHGGGGSSGAEPIAKTAIKLEAPQLAPDRAKNNTQVANPQGLPGGLQHLAAGPALSGRAPSKSTLQTDHATQKSKQNQLKQRDAQAHQSQLASQISKLTGLEASPLQTSARTRAADDRSERAGLGVPADFSIDTEEQRRRFEPAGLNQSFDHALQLLHASSATIQDVHRSQVFHLKAPITASDSAKGGHVADLNMASSQQSTAPYPFVAHHIVRKGGPKPNLNHVQSKLTAREDNGSLLLRTDQSLSAVQRSHAHFRRVQQQLQEKFDKQAFNVSYQVSDRSMALLRGTRGLKAGTSRTVDSIELHATARRAREKLESHIATVQQLVRERKRQIKQLQQQNIVQSKKLAEQAEINSRLDSLVGGREDQQLFGKQAAPSLGPLGAGNRSQDFMYQEENSDDQLAMLQHVHDAGFPNAPLQGSPQPTESAELDSNQKYQQDPTLSLSHPVAFAAEVQANAAYTRNAALGPSPPGLAQLPSAQKAVHDFYHHLFSADLRTSRDRAHVELQMHNDWRFNHVQEMSALISENETLKSHNRRYLKMIKEVKESLEGAENGAGAATPSKLVTAADLKKSAELNDVVKSVALLDLNAIGQELYKYGSPDQGDQQAQTKSELAATAQLTAHTPLTAAAARTQMSFMGKSRAGAAQPVDKKKLDGSIILFSRVYKEMKALDSIVTHLLQLKAVFKAHQLCLYVIAPELQLNLFRNPKERRQNYRKIFVNGGTTSMAEQAVYAVYGSEEDYCAPVFKDLDEAACHMFSSQVILIPLKSQNRVKLSLQIVYDAKAKGAKGRGGRGGGASRRATMRSGSAMKRTGGITDRRAGSQRQTSPQPARGAGSGLSAPRPRSLSGTASQRSGSKVRATKASAAPSGWTRNDYCLLKILANYLHMNVEYFDNKVISKAKEKKVDEIIDFAQDIMHVKTYRQLVKKVQEYRESVLGFEECALFFEDKETGNLFTLTDLEVAADPGSADRSSEGKMKTAFAKELLFPEDSVVVFPSTIGMTGEVHQRVGIRFRNGFGRLGREQQEVTDDAQSQKTGFSFSSALGNYKLPGQPPRNVQVTQLERIKEGNPQAENEADVNALLDDKMRHTGYSGRGLNPFRSAANASSERRASAERHAMDTTGTIEGSASPEPGFQKTTGTGLASPLLKAGWDAERRVGQSPMRRPAALELVVGDSQAGAHGATPVIGAADQRGASASQEKQAATAEARAGARPALPGQLLEVGGPSAGEAARRQPHASGNLANAPKPPTPPRHQSPEREKYYAEFLPDIDNFVGVKDLNNFVISAIKDDGYGFGERSAGILHLFNKLDKSRITKDDLARVEQFSRLVGALSVKAHTITTCLTLVIGLSQNVDAPTELLAAINSGMGQFDQVIAPVEALRKQIGIEQANRDEAAAYLAVDAAKAAHTSE